MKTTYVLRETEEEECVHVKDSELIVMLQKQADAGKKEITKLREQVEANKQKLTELDKKTDTNDERMTELIQAASALPARVERDTRKRKKGKSLTKEEELTQIAKKLKAAESRSIRVKREAASAEENLALLNQNFSEKYMQFSP